MTVTLPTSHDGDKFRLTFCILYSKISLLMTRYTSFVKSGTDAVAMIKLRRFATWIVLWVLHSGFLFINAMSVDNRNFRVMCIWLSMQMCLQEHKG